MEHHYGIDLFVYIIIIWKMILGTHVFEKSGIRTWEMKEKTNKEMVV